jgi:hypothetical protein
MPILGIIASQDYNRVTNSYESIATTTVGSGGSATVTFSSIPATYTHLQIRCISRSTVGNSNLFYKLNSDSSNTNYNLHILSGDGSSTSASAITSGSANSFILANEVVAKTTDTANAFGVTIIDFLDYSNTNKYKTTRALGGRDLNGSGGIALTSNLWQNTAAINTIVLNPDPSGSFVEYTQFALYGIKGA